MFLTDSSRGLIHRKNAATRQRAAAFKAYVKNENHFYLFLSPNPVAVLRRPGGIPQLILNIFSKVKGTSRLPLLSTFKTFFLPITKNLKL